ncbi:MAG: MotA/TolQ/ExbB proton channel family protein [Calditrichia bacterium]|jgi:biopolymer transport protein ExbB/TolQ|nr:MotA/TolQ/ExbB proton channel family protein [Calditrichia bacterium]
MEAFLAGFGRSFSPGDPAFIFMYVISLFAAAALAIAIERFYYIMIRSNINADKFMAEIRKLVAGGNMDRAIALCDRGKQKALPFVVLRGLKRAIESEALDFRAIQNAVDEGTLEVIPKLQERTNYLSMFANVATLTGLMGTIFGLIIAFDAVGGEGIPEADKTRYLAAGISAAMNTTIYGLMVAIPSLIAYTFLTNRTTKIIDEMDEHLVKLINLITGNR